jgi:hypothetical protein
VASCMSPSSSTSSRDGSSPGGRGRRTPASNCPSAAGAMRPTLHSPLTDQALPVGVDRVLWR